MATLMELLAKADEIIKGSDAKPKTMEEYKEQVKHFHSISNNNLSNMEDRKKFLEALDNEEMLKIAHLSWLLTWSASLRWTTINEPKKISKEILKRCDDIRTFMRSIALVKPLTVKDVVSQLKWLEEFSEKNKEHKKYYHYEIITYLDNYKFPDNWKIITDEEKTYIRDFVTKMDATCSSTCNACGSFKDAIESFLAKLDAV